MNTRARAAALTVVVVGLALSGCGSGKKPDARLSVATVQRAFRAQQIPAREIGCARIPITSGVGPYKYPADRGLVCQLSWSPPLKIQPNGQLSGGWQISAWVAADSRLVSELLAHPASRSELFIFGYEHFRVANVIVAVATNTPHTHLPARYEKRVRAVIPALNRLASGA
jgi:hypothetical protein